MKRIKAHNFKDFFRLDLNNLPVKMYELLCVGLYGHLPCPSNSSIRSNVSPDEVFDNEASASVDELKATATLSLVVD